MKIGVLSDTHIVTGGLGFRKIASQLISKSHEGLIDLKRVVDTHFKGVDRIVHAGDIVDPPVLELLAEMAPVDAVCGNMDGGVLARQLPHKKILDFEGHRIGLIHGSGGPEDVVERVRKEFKDVEAIVFGHTHSPTNTVIDGVLFFNPGSPTDRRFAPFNSIGILHVDASGIRGEIVRL